MHPSLHALATPDKPAFIFGESGISMTYAELDRRSNKAASLYRSLGLVRGDCLAIMMGNVPEYFELCWGAQRAGLYYVCISAKLHADEVAYILEDSDARALFVSPGTTASVAVLAARLPELSIFSTQPDSSCRDLRAAITEMPATPIEDESAGTDMLYSSGTTGFPKGIRHPLPEGPIVAATPFSDFVRDFYGMGADTVFLSPAPLYHSAPLRFSMVVQRHGGTVIVMDKFDAERALALIERYRATHAQFVPTHFVRMLKLPEEVRDRYDVSSLRAAFHASAPCPVPVKYGMIDWLGPIIHEYYSGTEGNGITALDAAEWLAHPGSVGKPVNCRIVICDEDGEPLPLGSEGHIYFADGPAFAYHNDPEKTQASYNRHGWSTIGDIGRLDEDGYLYLTDRKGFMIISGGVNIYPQEIENLLITHPKVADVAVFGVPDDEMGESVLAVVQPERWSDSGPELANELMGYARENLSHVKAPRRVEFRHELPRHATGKLYKRLLRDEYRDRATKGAANADR